MWTVIVSMQLPKQIKTGKIKAKMSLTSLLQERGRDMIAFAFFFAISSGFWLLQKLDDTFETDIVLPIELVHVPEGTIITSPLPEEVTITIQDRGTNLFDYMRRGSGLKPIQLDFSNYENGSSAAKVIVPVADVQRAFQHQMFSSTQVMRMQPNVFEFHYNRGVCRRVPVKYVGSISTKQQNYLQSVLLSPDSVTIYAPSHILDTLQYAYTEKEDFVNLGKTSTYSLSFPKMAGVKAIPETVKLTANVDYYTEQTIKVPVTGLNFPAGVSLKTFPAEVSIKYRVGAANSRNIKTENFVLTATYEELLENPNQKYRLQLKVLPFGVSNVRIFPQEIDYLLEYTDLDVSIH